MLQLKITGKVKVFRVTIFEDREYTTFLLFQVILIIMTTEKNTKVMAENAMGTITRQLSLTSRTYYMFLHVPAIFFLNYLPG